MKTEEWIEEYTDSLNKFQCAFCSGTRIRKIIAYSYFGPPTDLSVCDKCGGSNWIVKEKKAKVSNETGVP